MFDLCPCAFRQFLQCILQLLPLLNLDACGGCGQNMQMLVAGIFSALAVKSYSSVVLLMHASIKCVTGRKNCRDARALLKNCVLE